ncbi:hypothetical protein Tco_1478709, partial [Tanacetum coccineum]
MSAATEALITAVAAALPSSSSLPTSLLSHWSSPIPQIPSPPLLVPSPPLPLPSPPTHTSLTYAEALLGYREAMIQDELPEVDMPLRKRARFTAPTGRFEVRESSSTAAARQARHTLAHRV